MALLQPTSSIHQLPQCMRPSGQVRDSLPPWKFRNCGFCNDLIEHYDGYQSYCPRCPECHRFINEDDRLHVETVGSCLCQYHVCAGTTWCVCPCLCTDESDDSDESFGPADKDNLDEALEDSDDDQPEIDIQPKHVRQYGMFTAALKEDGKSLWYESSLHYHAAAGHDIGRPDESSFANSENYISQREVHELHEGMQPEELEGVMQAYNLTLSQIAQCFPEAELYRVHSAQSARPPPLSCRRCERFMSDESRQLLDHDELRLCQNCWTVIRPQSVGDDPDFADGSNFNVYGFDNCSCRCDCITSVPMSFYFLRRYERAVAFARRRGINLSDICAMNLDSRSEPDNDDATTIPLDDTNSSNGPVRESPLSPLPLPAFTEELFTAQLYDRQLDDGMLPPPDMETDVMIGVEAAGNGTDTTGGTLFLLGQAIADQDWEDALRICEDLRPRFPEVSNHIDTLIHRLRSIGSDPDSEMSVNA